MLVRFGPLARLAVILLGTYELGLFGRVASNKTADDASVLMEYLTVAEAQAAEEAPGEDAAAGVYYDGEASADSARSDHEDKNIVASAGQEVVEDTPEEGKNESVASLFGMTYAEIYSVAEDRGGEDQAEDELLLVITDEDTLNFLAELLAFSEYPTKSPAVQARFVIELKAGRGDI